MTFVSRHPLEGVLSAAPGAPGLNHLSVPHGRALWSVLAHRGREAAVGEALAAIDGLSPRVCGPQEWLAVADATEAGRVGAALAAIEGASVVEQGDGRTVFSLSGPHARALLAKGTAVDLHPAAFAVGRSANALVFHVAGNIARVGENSYEIVVMRSFAPWVFEELTLLGREFGLTAGFGA